jgi:hypothetical protein
MSRDKLIIGGLLVAALLGFLVWKQSQKDADLGKPTATAKDFPTISAPDDIDKISLVNGEKGEVVVERVADPKGGVVDGGPATVWQVTRPVKAMANQQTMKDLVANLAKVKVDSQVNLKLDDEVRKDKQLDKAKGVHVTAFKGGEKKVDETFGKGGAGGTTLVVVADKPDLVWAAKDYQSYLYTKSATDYRDKEIFKFDDTNVASASIVNSHGTFSFTKGDKWAGTFEKKAIEKLDEDKVKEFLRAYKGLNGNDFGDNKTPADVGLDKPEATVSFTLKDNAGHFEVQVGKISTGTEHWAKRAADDVIYTITASPSEWAFAEVTKFQQASDAGAAPAGSAKPAKTAAK